MTTNRFLTVVAGFKTLTTAIAASVGVGDASKIVATGSDGRLDATLMPTGFGASTVLLAASENLAAGDFVNVWNDAGTPKVRKADASNGRQAHGFVLQAVTSAQNATVYRQGLNTSLTGLTSGQDRFLSATVAGTSTTTVPTTTGHLIQRLGPCLSATALDFENDSYISIG